MKRLDLTTMEKDVKNLRQSFIALHEVVQQQIIYSIDTKIKMDQLHETRYEPSALIHLPLHLPIFKFKHSKVKSPL